MRIVRRGAKPQRRDASCWSVLVLKGGFGWRLLSFVPKSSTTSRPARIAASALFASSSLLIVTGLPSNFSTRSL